MDGNLSRGYCQLRLDTPDDGVPPSNIGGNISGNDRRQNYQRPLPNSGQTSLQPVDRCSCIYLALILCGVGFLLPYNSFITAVDYYHDKFIGSTIIFDLSLTYICMAFISVIANNLLVELFSLHTRITFGYILSFIMLLLIALLDIWYEMFSPEVSYRMTLAAVGIIALGCTVQQSSFYGYTSMLPSRYTQAVMVGESAAGLIVSINRVLTKALMPNDVKLNTIIFFLISIITVFMCCVIFHATRRTKFVRYYVSLCKSAGIADDQRGITNASNPEEVSLVDILDGTVTRDSYGVLVIHSPTSPTVDGAPNIGVRYSAQAAAQTQANVVTSANAIENEVQVKGQGQAYRRHLSTWDAIKRGCVNRYRASRHVWPYMLSIGGAYFVTLCLFPGVETEVVSCRLYDWMPIILISIFNLFDFIGKIIASVPYDWPRGRLALCTMARVLLVPLLMLCAAPRDKPVITGEGWPILFSAILGITNGYFGSVPMILAPSRVPDEQKELTGNIMTLSYSLGLTTGSALAYLLDDWLGPHLEVDTCGLPMFNITGYSNITIGQPLFGPMINGPIET